MALGTTLLAVAILSVISFFRELKRRNFVGVGFSVISILVFGFFSVMTLFVSGAPEA
ncbi:cell division protein FtsW (lipid II flippase) [Geomicrobium halophilum]|uniref:Cell division protein FtsW (Lipid II flippase) n=1 Tax=Geomicrobium halophilum TaxID=549000 RepID=A0A841PXX1_9BACL|nr:DUF2759 domain-containing protein [Geomicrobium halophilum]MBB6448895.1 cell division protein FtsW (lipid II flippase) [Geomicrobium halophilum]